MSSNSTLVEADSVTVTIAVIFRNLFGLLLLVCFIICLLKFAERQESKSQRRSMLNDTDAEDVMQGGLELTELQAANEGGSTSSTVDNSLLVGMGGVRCELAKLQLEKYADAFEQHGFDNWPEIMRLPRDRFTAMAELTGMSKNHVDRLQEQLAKQRRATNGRVQRAAISGSSSNAEEVCVIL